MQAREMQLLGMVGNPDEDVFPLVWTAEARYDGFYRVLDASWTWVNDGSSRASVANWSVTLEAIADRQAPVIEQYSNSLVRTNGHSITTVSSALRFAIPTAATDTDQGDVVLSGNQLRPSVDGGSTLTLYNSVTTLTGDPIRYWLPASAFYNGSCRVEYQADDSGWYPLVGRDMPHDAAGRWRLSNGSFRLEPTSTVGVMAVSIYNGSAWESVNVAANAFFSGAHEQVTIAASTTTWLVPSILRNSPDSVTISTSGTSTATGRYQQVFTLRRGDYFVDLTTWGISGRPGVRAVSTTASTALSTATLGLRATSNDANGNRLVLAGAPAVVNDLTNGRIYVDVATSNLKHSFAIGIEYDGSSAATNNTALQIARQFIAPASVVSRVLVR
jgi:hypothetical protein